MKVYLVENFEEEVTPELKYYAFDWDDNLVDMPTKIVYFSKESDSQFEKIYISTDLFAFAKMLNGCSEAFLNARQSPRD